MRRRRIAGIALLSLPFVVVGAIWIYLETADLSRYRGRVERAVSQALGRELTIAGRFEPEIGRRSRVLAEDVRLANPEWSTQPSMVRVERLTIELDLWSLISGPVRVHDLRIDGAEVLLERNDDGQANWSFRSSKAKPQTIEDTGEPPRDGPPIVFDNVEIAELRLDFEDASAEQPWTLELESLQVHPEDPASPGGMLALTVAGKLNGEPLRLGGQSGPLDAWIKLKNIENRLNGALGSTEFELDGTVQDLSRLKGLELKLEIGGPDLIDLTRTFGLKELGQGAFHVSATTAPASSGNRIDLQASVGKVQAEVRGDVNDLFDPQHVRLELDASGSDLKRIGELFGFDELPAGDFEASGKFRREGSAYGFDKLRARVGANTVALHGDLGVAPGMVGTDIVFEADWPDATTLTPLLGIDFPQKPMKATGRLARLEQGLQLEAVRVELGQGHLTASGVVGLPPDFLGTDVVLEGRGADLSGFGALFGVDLPAQTFAFDGGLVPAENGLALKNVQASVGSNQATLEGFLGKPPELVGTDVELQVAGPDLQLFVGLLTRIDETRFPNAPFDVRGRTRVLEDGYELESVEAAIGPLRLSGGGRLGALPELVGSDLELRVQGPDLSWLGPVLDVSDLPASPYDIEGRIAVQQAGYQLHDVDIRLGELTGRFAGRLGRPPALAGTLLRIESSGPNLARLSDLPWIPQLPAGQYSVSGELQIDGGVYGLGQVSAELAGNEIEVNGTLGPFPGPKLDLTFLVSGPDLSTAAALGEELGLDSVEGLPQKPFSIQGSARSESELYRLGDVRIELGPARLRADGLLGATASFIGTDLEFEGTGLDGSVFSALTGVALPPEPFDIRGRLARTETDTLLENVRATLGEHLLQADGKLGELPKLVGTDLDLRIQSPGTSLLAELAGLDGLPDAPYSLTGHFVGNPQQFVAEGLELKFGESDLQGSLHVDLRGKPSLSGELTSQLVDFGPLLGLPDEVPPETNGEESERSKDPETTESAKPRTDKGRQLLFSSEPLDLSWLDQLDADIRWNIDSARFLTESFSQTGLTLRLEDERLAIDPLTITGMLGGQARAALTLEPAEPGYRLSMRLDADQIRIGLFTSAAHPDLKPPTDLHLDLEAIGASPHELAASANAELAVRYGRGRIDNSLVSLLATDLVLKITRALNPWSREEQYTELQCGVLFGEINQGLALIAPLAMRTDKMNIVGRGEIDFRTEDLNVTWKAKPRKGVGVGTSTITNPYIKLGGRLAHPEIHVKPLEATLTTGAAVATLGASLLAKGMWDRFAPKGDVCAKAEKKAAKLKKKHSEGGR